MSPEEFRKKYAKSGNEILDEYSNFINQHYIPQDISQKAKKIIGEISDIFLNDPENYHFDANIYLGIKKLTELLPETKDLAHLFWKQVPIFSHSPNPKAHTDNYYGGDCFDDGKSDDDFEHNV